MLPPWSKRDWDPRDPSDKDVDLVNHSCYDEDEPSSPKCIGGWHFWDNLTAEWKKEDAKTSLICKGILDRKYTGIKYFCFDFFSAHLCII